MALALQDVSFPLETYGVPFFCCRCIPSTTYASSIIRVSFIFLSHIERKSKRDREGQEEKQRRETGERERSKFLEATKQELKVKGINWRLKENLSERLPWECQMNQSKEGEKGGEREGERERERTCVYSHGEETLS